MVVWQLIWNSSSVDEQREFGRASATVTEPGVASVQFSFGRGSQAFVIVRTFVVFVWFLVTWLVYCCYRQCNAVTAIKQQKKTDNRRNKTHYILLDRLGEKDLEMIIGEPVVLLAYPKNTEF